MKNKKLYRVNEGKIIAGVCGGFGEFFDIDPNLIRVGLALFSCFGGAGIAAYIVAAIILPVKSDNIIDV